MTGQRGHSDVGGSHGKQPPRSEGIPERPSSSAVMSERVTITPRGDEPRRVIVIRENPVPSQPEPEPKQRLEPELLEEEPPQAAPVALAEEHPQAAPVPTTHMEGDFELDADEHIVRSREWGYIEGASLINKSQMCLTNKNIRVIHRGMFNKMRKNGDVCLPLDKVEIHDGAPKMVLDAHEDFSRLMITFDGEARVIHFATGMIAAGWANDISLLLVDKPFEPAQPVLHPPFDLGKTVASAAGSAVGAVAGLIFMPIIVIGCLLGASPGGPPSGPDGN